MNAPSDRENELRDALGYLCERTRNLLGSAYGAAAMLSNDEYMENPAMRALAVKAGNQSYKSLRELIEIIEDTERLL